MDHEHSTQGMHQASMPSGDDWEAFFHLCREYAQVARLRRETAGQKTAAGHSDTQAADTRPMPASER